MSQCLRQTLLAGNRNTGKALVPQSLVKNPLAAIPTSNPELIRDTMGAEIVSTSAMGLLAGDGQLLKAKEMDTPKG